MSKTDFWSIEKWTTEPALDFVALRLTNGTDCQKKVCIKSIFWIFNYINCFSNKLFICLVQTKLSIIWIPSQAKQKQHPDVNRQDNNRVVDRFENENKQLTFLKQIFVF